MAVSMRYLTSEDLTISVSHFLLMIKLGFKYFFKYFFNFSVTVDIQYYISFCCMT